MSSDLAYRAGRDRQRRFIYIPAHLIHRESVAAEGGEGIIVRVGGVVATFDVEGPNPAT
jgi:hypothetical protein